MTFESCTESFWTPARREMHSWFQRNAPSLGELYEATLRILFDCNIPGKTRLVAHAVREIGNNLPDVIAGTTLRNRVEYVQRCDDIVEELKRTKYSLEAAESAAFSGGEPPSSYVRVPLSIMKSFVLLVRDHERGRERNSDKALRLLNAINPENIALKDYLRPIIRQWLGTINWFMQFVHDNGSRDQDANMNEFNDKFRFFEDMLSSILREFYKTVEDLDEILDQTNS